MIRPAVLLLVLLPLPAAADQSAATAFGEAFCAASVDDDMTPIQARLSPELAGLLDAAIARNAEFEAAYPGEKPPLGDGIPWTSWSDYADGCAVSAVEHAATASSVTIHYSFSEWPDISYDNVLVVVPESSEADDVLLDDIRFDDGSTFREVLTSISEAPL
jgi:hypothetical protein